MPIPAHIFHTEMGNKPHEKDMSNPIFHVNHFSSGKNYIVKILYLNLGSLKSNVILPKKLLV